MVDAIDIGSIRRPNGWSPIRRELDVRSFGINAWSGEKDATLVGEHDEVSSGHEEVYVVVSGAARFEVGGEELDAGAGMVVFARDPAAKRAAVATEDGTVVLSVGGKPGEAFEPRVWEVNAEVFGLVARGEVEEAKQLVTEALTQYDDRSALTYNLACCEARLGEVDQALTHLATAIELRESLSELARDDTDFDALRGDPRFAELVGEPAVG